jgi:hypothetical protein
VIVAAEAGVEAARAFLDEITDALVCLEDHSLETKLAMN